jgi:ubiquinone/menaquinone biosynthesis C-methylase UbiE
LTLVATDYDAGMVAHARKTLATFGGRATVQQVDAAQLPFEDDRFDLVLSFAMLHHVGGWPGAVREALRCYARADASLAMTPWRRRSFGCCTAGKGTMCG